MRDIELQTFRCLPYIRPPQPATHSSRAGSPLPLVIRLRRTVLSFSGVAWQDCPSAQLRGGAIGKWGVRPATLAPKSASRCWSACRCTVAANQRGSLPMSLVARIRSGRASDSCYPLPRHPAPSSSKSRRLWIPAAGSKRGASGPRGVQPGVFRANPAPSTRASPSP